MLSYLRIRNFGLFKDVELELGPGLTVFTGETGAGKSMLVDAVMACLGQRTPRDLLRTGEERAVIELAASLPRDPDDLEDPLEPFLEGSREVILQKDILPDRSYLRLNGRLATSSIAQEVGERLVDIHGQQEHHSLLKPQNYLGILDGLSRSSIEPGRRDFELMYKERQEIHARMADLGKGGKERQREIDLLSYQVREIDEAKLRPGEEDELRREFSVLSSQEKLMELAERCYAALYDGRGQRGAAYELIDEALECLRKVSSIDSSASTALNSLQETFFALETALDFLREYRKGLTLDPGRLKAVSDRLDLIQRLKSKYGDSPDAVLDYAKKARERLAELLRSDEILLELKDKLDRIETKMRQAGASLSARRRETASRMSDSVTCSLQQLGMPRATFLAQVESGDDPFPWGYDRVNFLFTANTGEAPLPVHKVASGGELSRLMLAIKSFLESSDPVPTLIFDEIDAGIGGKAGQAVGEALRRLGRTHQVLCVTHLASIAALADNHYLVSKEEEEGRTHATVRLLTGEERVPEVARMLSGTEDAVSLDHARELLRGRTT